MGCIWLTLPFHVIEEGVSVFCIFLGVTTQSFHPWKSTKILWSHPRLGNLNETWNPKIISAWDINMKICTLIYNTIVEEGGCCNCNGSSSFWPNIIYQMSYIIYICLFKHGFLDTLNHICICGFDIETLNYFFLHYPKFTNERQNLLLKTERIISDTFWKSDNSITSILLYGDPSFSAKLNTSILNSFID